VSENLETPILGSLFSEAPYRVPGQNRLYRSVNMTRDGFTLLAMGFTGYKALKFKVAYIQRFNEMEED